MGDVGTSWRVGEGDILFGRLMAELGDFIGGGLGEADENS